MAEYISERNFGQHHSFDADLAVKLKSVELAVLVHHFQYWIRHNAEMGKNLHEGRTWTFQTLKDIAAHFPYWSYKQVERLVNKLVELEILIKGNFNTSTYDRTVWYAFKNESRFCISRNREMEIPESGNQNPEIGTPIPDTLPYREKKKKKTRARESIEFDYEQNSFVNIEDPDIADWQTLYPGVDVKRELAKMRQWLLDPANPARDGNRTFITNWLEKAYKDAKKAPKKMDLPTSDVSPGLPYDPSIAYGILHEEGEAEYIDYLKSLSDQKYYTNFLNGIFEKNYQNYLDDKDL